MVPLNVRSYVSTTTCLMWLSICSSFYNTLEDTSWNKSSFIRVDGNRVRLVYHTFFLDSLLFCIWIHFNFHCRNDCQQCTCTQLFHLLIFFKCHKGRKFKTTRVLSKLFDTIWCLTASGCNDSCWITKQSPLSWELSVAVFFSQIWVILLAFLDRCCLFLLD